MSGSRRKAGRLSSQVEGYRAWLVHQGYTPQTVVGMLKDLGQVGLWMSDQRLTAAQLDEAAMTAFRGASCMAGRRKVLGPRALAPLLSYLRQAGVTPLPAPVETPVEVLLSQFRTWLLQERGLAAATVLRYENTARRFLRQHAVVEGVFHPAILTGVDVNTFLLQECGRVSAGSAKGRVAELRSILRFLHLRSLTPMQLGWAVPPVGGWRLAALPPTTVSAADVQRLLDGCDRRTDIGVRDFAIMMLVARLGLRSVEVARLELRDVDWRAGELVIRGKARRQDRLPLPSQVGEALVAYLSGARAAAGAGAAVGARSLFVTCTAPRTGIRADLVGDVVERACLRAGLPRVGPHRLRHALAHDLLAHGAGLVAISQVLRHQDLATTALYAKVDLVTLRQVARPWPGTAR
jgi:site-specific recombinase XerD